MKIWPKNKYKSFQVFFGITSLIWLALSVPFFASALAFKINVADTNQSAKTGDRLYFDADIKYPENRERKDLRIKYEIVQEGEVIAESATLRAIETQMQFYDYIIVPLSAKTGLAQLRVTLIDYSDLYEDATVSFMVAKGEDTTLQYVYIIIGSIFFIGVLISLQVYVMHQRTRMLIAMVSGHQHRAGFIWVLVVVVFLLASLLLLFGPSMF